MKVVTGLNDEDRFTVVRIQQFVMTYVWITPVLHACYNGIRNVDTRTLNLSESELPRVFILYE